MYQTPEHFVTANKAAIDTLLQGANAALVGVEQIAQLNLSTLRAALDDSTANTEALFAAKDVKDAAALQSSLIQPSVERAVSYSRSLYGIAVETQQQFAKQIEAQFGEFQTQVTSLVEKAAKNTPAGSDAAVSAVKTAFAATHSAFDSMNKAAQQFAEATERNIAAAGEDSVSATTKAVAAKRK